MPRKITSAIASLRKIKIQYRLLAVFFFISLVPTICLGAYAYRVYTDSINKKLGDSSLQAVLSLNKNMVTELEKLQDYISTLSVSDTIQEGLYQMTGEDGETSRELVIGISDMTKMIPFQSKYLKNLRVADISGNIVYVLGYDDISKERFMEIIKGIDSASPKDSMQYIHTYRSSDKIILGRKLYNVNALIDPIGYIMVYIDEHLISDKIFSGVSFGDSSNVMLVSSDGVVISSQDREFLGQKLEPRGLFDEVTENLKNGISSFNTEVNGIPSLVIAAYNSQFDNYLIANIPKSYFTNETRSINRMLFIVGSLLILLSLFCTLFVYVSITRPIRHMVRICDENSEKNGSFSGIGVNNVSERLRIHYGGTQRLTITSEEGRGTVCRLDIPYVEK